MVEADTCSAPEPESVSESLWPFDFIPFTNSYRTRHKLTNRSRVPLIYLLSGSLLAVVFAAQLFVSRDTTTATPPDLQTATPVATTYSPFGDSVYRQEAYFDQLAPGEQCKPKNILSAELPTSREPYNMARRGSLADEVVQVAQLFSYPPEEVNKGVKAFIQQMDEGLEKQGTMMSQIPTYVTNVPNGTEKVELVHSYRGCSKLILYRASIWLLTWVEPTFGSVPSSCTGIPLSRYSRPRSPCLDR
jgi:hypothetical protein